MQKRDLILPEVLETDRLLLRPYQAGDATNFLEMLNEGNRDYLDELLGPISQETDLEKIETYVQNLASNWISLERFILSYWLKTSKQLLGHIWIEPQNWEIGTFVVGWFVTMQNQGQGYATEAVECAIEFIFRDLKGQKINVTVRNHGKYREKSKRIAERCGFSHEGFIRHSVRIHTSKGAGPIVGEFHYGLLRSEYNSI